MNTRYTYVLLLLMAVLCAGCGSVASPTASPTSAPAPAAQPNALRARPTPSSGGAPSTTNTTTTTSRSGDMVLTTSLDENGCAIDSTTTFTATDAIYVVLHEDSVRADTAFFARLYDATTALEDTEEAVADQDYQDVCVNFEFAPQSGESWQAGAYQIEFFINGNSYQFADFQIR